MSSVRCRVESCKCRCAQGVTPGARYTLPTLMPMIPKDLPFKWKRLQCLVKLLYAMVKFKSQGQTFKYVSTDLPSDYLCTTSYITSTFINYK